MKASTFAESAPYESRGVGVRSEQTVALAREAMSWTDIHTAPGYCIIRLMQYSAEGGIRRSGGPMSTDRVHAMHIINYGPNP